MRGKLEELAQNLVFAPDFLLQIKYNNLATHPGLRY